MARALLCARGMHREVSFAAAAFALVCISSAACGTSNGAGGSSGDGSGDAGLDSSGGIVDDGTCPAGCVTPPGACFAAKGSCQKGTCSYAFSEGATCDDGDPCTSGDTCTARACRGISDPTCRASGGDAGAGGDGAPGSCANVTCNQPPPSSCNGAVLTTHDNVGTCAAGVCSYPAHQITCANGCADGVCTQTGWASAQSNTNVDLNGVWGSAANSIWAVGNNGVAMYWNGAQWQSRNGGTFAPILRVHGTSATNVFALALVNGGFDVMRFDGTQWSKLTTINGNYQTQAGDVFAIGDNDAFVYITFNTDQPGDLYRVTNGTATKLGSSGVNQGQGYTGVWAFSPTNVWITGVAVSQYDGSKFTPVGTSPPSSGLLWALNPDFVFAGWTQSPSLYGANHQWTITNTGQTGVTTGFCGTSTTRVFAGMAYGGNYGIPSTGRIVRYDGLGWTPETIPAGVPSLMALWCAPTGEAVAVGNAGAIVMGP